MQKLKLYKRVGSSIFSQQLNVLYLPQIFVFAHPLTILHLTPNHIYIIFDAQHMKRTLMQFADKSIPWFMQADQRLCCPLTESMHNEVYVDKQKMFR